MLGDIHRKRRLAHRRSTADDDQLAAVHSVEARVQIHEAGRRASDAARARLVIKVVDALDDARKRLDHRMKLVSAARRSFRETKNPGLRLVKNL
ncbi:hypothetical protein F4827_005057 [Paraburkholderia bannensis]|uniref:Uncharacterized protein n=1 Tax=Paraburkholderia bannensis TaxID=765414 RepID=A0A7W9WV89_9BURK|nr:hypothetical protein [Paraburkholderia sp. WP4_3_2]MBB6105191.1 hypothetical protein [Paraburkholderia bannensis]